MTEEGAVPFAAALDFLYDKRLRDGGKAYSDREVADGLRANGVSVSHAYLWMLRTGKKEDPRVNLVMGLARFFDVPAGYFLDREVHDRWRKRLTAAPPVSEPPVQRGASPVMLRGFPGMSERSHSLLEALAEHVSALEGEDGTTARD